MTLFSQGELREKPALNLLRPAVFRGARGITELTLHSWGSLVMCVCVFCPADPRGARPGESDPQGAGMALPAQRQSQETGPEDHPEG